MGRGRPVVERGNAVRSIERHGGHGPIAGYGEGFEVSHGKAWHGAAAMQLGELLCNSS